jgi:hypothetical protein
MTAITLQKMKDYTSINLSVSKWDADKKYNDNEKKIIGTIIEDGKPAFYNHFLTELQDSPELMEKVKQRFPNANLSLVDNNDIIKPRAINRFPGESVPFGITYFLYNIAESIGLLKHLKESFTEDWKTIFTVASFLVFENKAIMECDDFVKDNITFPVGTLASQRTSELFFRIKQEQYNLFSINGTIS